MGPKPVVGKDQTGFSPDDQNFQTELNYVVTCMYCILIISTATLKHKYVTIATCRYKSVLNVTADKTIPKHF